MGGSHENPCYCQETSTDREIIKSKPGISLISLMSLMLKKLSQFDLSENLKNSKVTLQSFAWLAHCESAFQ